MYIKAENPQLSDKMQRPLRNKLSYMEITKQSSMSDAWQLQAVIYVVVHFSTKINFMRRLALSNHRDFLFHNLFLSDEINQVSTKKNFEVSFNKTYYKGFKKVKYCFAGKLITTTYI